MATVTPIMPTQGIAAPASAAAPPDISAMFAAMLASAPQVDGTANNAAQPDAALPQNIVAPTTPVNFVSPATDPAMAFAVPNMQTQADTVSAPSQKDSTRDPAAMAAIMAAAQMPVVATPGDSTAPADSVTPKMPVALKPSTKQSPKRDAAPIAVPIPIAQTPIANTPVQAANAAVGDVMSAPKQAAPNTPGSSAAPQQGGAAIVNAAAQTNIKPAPAAQVTQAQALPVQFDLSASGQNARDNSGNSRQQASQQQQQQIAQAQSAPSVAPAHAMPQDNSAGNSAPATPQITTATAIVPAASAPVHVDTAVQVSAQNSSTPVPYNIGAIAVSIAAKSEAGVKHFDIRLDPPEMGVIDVRLSVDDSGKAVAHLSADKPQTLQLLQSDSGNLSRALKDSGVDLANNGLNFSLRSDQRQANQSSQQQQPRGQARARALSVSAVASPGFNSVPVSSYAPGSVALDITV